MTDRSGKGRYVWESAYTALDPAESLGLRSEAYVDRPEAPLRRLQAALAFATRPALYLVSGHIGTGKSTELMRLVEDLSDSHVSFLEQVDVDYGRSSDDDRLFLTLLSLAAEALARGADWREIRQKRRASNIRDVVASFDLLGIKVKSRRLQFDGPTFSDISKAVDRVRRRSAREPLIVLDGFDKLPLADLERFFSAIHGWGELPVSVVLTVPLSFLFTPTFGRGRGQFGESAVVPAIRTMQRDGQLDREGVVWMRHVLDRRGVGHLFEPDAATIVARLTGGILRDFLRVAREAVLSAHLDGSSVVTTQHAEHAAFDFSLGLSRAVSPQHLRLLYAVHRSGRVIGDSSFLDMIDAGQIIEYREDSNWYAVHPMLRPAVEALGGELESTP